MTLDDLERQYRGFYWFFRDIELRKSISFTRRRHRRQRHTRLWPMCIMVPMCRVQVICDFRNYNYWTGNAIGFRASRELFSNFLFFTHSALPACPQPLLVKSLQLVEVRPYAEEEEGLCWTADARTQQHSSPVPSPTRFTRAWNCVTASRTKHTLGPGKKTRQFWPNIFGGRNDRPAAEQQSNTKVSTSYHHHHNAYK